MDTGYSYKMVNKQIEWRVPNGFQSNYFGNRCSLHGTCRSIRKLRTTVGNHGFCLCDYRRCSWSLAAGQTANMMSMIGLTMLWLGN